MSTPTVDSIPRESATKVRPSFGPALEVLGMNAKAKIKKEAAEDAARVLKATFRLLAPVEPVGIAEELDTRVVEMDLEEDILGMLRIKPGDETKICLNMHHGVLRRRLTCALELGHYVRHAPEAKEYGRIDRRTDRATSGDDADLIYAEEFAAWLLMPECEFRALAELGVDELEIALRFQVPRDVVQRKLADLGFRAAELSEA
jgi:Zn-dependent peptidase ImmA (M78 family)